MRIRERTGGLRPKSLPAGAELIQLARLLVEGENFALNIMIIKEIARLPEITRIPQAPDFLEGFINLRGAVIPLINLSRRLGLGTGALQPKARVVIVKHENEVFGLVVDEVLGVIRIPASEILPPPRVIRGKIPEFLGGVVRLGGELILVLDLEKVLSLEEIKEMKKMGVPLGGKR
ncbi:MAG: chemotaxis protein CheW [bacterium]|nr:chemotaxis protein CheW [bacterium]